MSTEQENELSTEAQAPSETPSQDAPQVPSDASDANVAEASADQQDSSAQLEARQDDQEDQSLTTPKDVASTAQSQQEIDPEAFKRLRDEKSQWGRQMAELKRNNEAIRQQLAQYQQEHEKAQQLAEKQKLKLYDYRHPEHATKFQPILQKAELVRAQLQRLNATKPPDGLSPEQAEVWRDTQKNLIYSTLDESEQAALDEFAQHTQQFQRNFAINPGQAIGSYVEPMFEQFWERKMTEFRADQEVEKDLQDPVLGPIFKEFNEPMQEMIQKLGGTDEAYEMARHHARLFGQNRSLYDENARLKQQLTELGVKANAAEAQQQLAKGRASITKDAPARTVTDPFEQAKAWAKKNGVSTSDPAFFHKISELEHQGA